MRRHSTTKGFKATSSLLQKRIKDASESRGFAQTRLLTHWEEIVGADIAQCAIPIEVKFGRGFGGTLTILTTGAYASLLQMQVPQIQDKVNACYGYSAIAKIRITQTARTGFNQGRVQFGSSEGAKVQLPAELKIAADNVVSDVTDDGLRLALAALGANVMHKSKHKNR
jgi:hypothetical protein